MTYVLDRELSFEEYLAYDDGTDYRYELVDGSLVRMNPPRGRHGKIIRFLNEQFQLVVKQAKQPWVPCWDTGVRTKKKMVRIPDLVVITQEQEDAIDEISAVLETLPLLIVEVVSPGEQKVIVHWLQGRRYQATEYVGSQPITSVAFPVLALTAEQVLHG